MNATQFFRALEIAEGKSFPVGTRRKWARGEVIKQKDGSWISADQKAAYAVSAGFMNAEPPKETPPINKDAPPKPDVATVIASTLTPKFRVGSMRIAGEGHSSSKLAAAIDKLRDEGKSAGKLSRSKYQHKQLAVTYIAPESQKQVREGMRMLLAQYGILSKDGLRSGGNSLLVARGAKNVLATHSQTTGLVTIRAGELDDASSFLKKKGTNATQQEIEGIGGLIHEEIHGHSPIPRQSYLGNVTFLEESTVELSARKILRDTYGLSDEESTDSTFNTYNCEIETLKNMTRGALARNGIETPPDRAWWEDFMGAAAIKMRRTDEVDAEPSESFKRFARGLPVPKEAIEAAAKMQQKTPDQIREGIQSSLVDIVHKEGKAYYQHTRKTYISPGMVKRARALVAKERKKSPDVKAWYAPSGGIYVGSKPKYVGSEDMEEFVKRVGTKVESAPAVPVYDPKFPGPELIWDLKRNDMIGAFKVGVELLDSGLDYQDYASILLALQDDDEILREAFEALYE